MIGLERVYQLQGGPCAGDEKRVTCYFTNGIWTPPPFIKAIAREPLPLSVADPAAVTASVPIHTYLRSVHYERLDTWFEYHYEAPARAPASDEPA